MSSSNKKAAEAKSSKDVQEYEIVKVKISDLEKDAGNPNRMSLEQLNGLEKSFTKFGNLQPVTINQHNKIIDGHQRAEVYQALGIDEIPAFRYNSNNRLDELQLQQTMNKLRGTHVPEIDADILKHLLEQDKDKVEELSTLIASSKDELYLLIEKFNPEFDAYKFANEQRPESLEIKKEFNKRDAVTKEGEVWFIDRHRVICGDNVTIMKKHIPDNFFDLTVTSPPYDQLREYHGYTFNFEALATELYRVTKPGGVVVWVVGDETINGSETGTSFKHALHFKEIGFKLHDTMIYERHGRPKFHNGRYRQVFEYMFVLSKDTVPNTTNLLTDRHASNAGRVDKGYNERRTDGSVNYKGTMEEYPDFTIRSNIWYYHPPRGVETEHPAIFPFDLAFDHIRSWTNEGDQVFDPFLGSGTTLKMSILGNRICTGIDISPRYCDIAIDLGVETTGVQAARAEQ